MTVPPRRQRSVSDVLEWLVLALLAAVATKIVASVISGFIEWARSGNQFDFDRKHRAGDVILQFTAFGDGVTGLLLLSIAGLVYWHIRTRPAWFHGRRLALTTTVLAAATALAALLAIVGYALYLSGQPRIAGPLVGYAGRGLSDAIIAGAAAVGAYRLTWALDEQLAEAPGDLIDDLDDDEDDGEAEDAPAG